MRTEAYCAKGGNIRPGVPTTAFERGLLALSIVALPAENHFLFIPGFSIQFILFGIIAAYLVLYRYSELMTTAVHPALLAAYLFFFIGFTMEVTQVNHSYDELVRIAQMIVGAVLVASLCRDLPALRTACYGYLAAGLWLSILLFMTSYGALNAASASNFQEASRLRADAFEANPLEANLNNMAFGAAQAAIVALSWGLLAQRTVPRGLYVTAGLLCLIGAFLPLSRSGVAIALTSCTSVMYAFGLRHAKGFLIAAFLAGAVLMLVPQAVWSRMSFTFEKHEGKTEGRALVYGTAMERLPDYFMTGVGAGNFWTSWGRRTEFASESGRVSGSHNSFMQVTLYWGILGLTGFMLVFWKAYRCIPRYANREAAALALVGIGVSILLFAMVSHNIYAKEFTLALGLLVGSHRWIWPQGFVYASSGLKRKRPF